MTFSPTSPVSLHTYLDACEHVHVTLPTLALLRELHLVKKGVQTPKPRPRGGRGAAATRWAEAASQPELECAVLA